MFLTKDKLFYRELFKLALPIALGSLVTYSITLSDNMLIARLGTEAVSAVYLSNQIAFLLTMLIAGIEGAVLVLSSHSFGKGENEKGRQIATLGIVFAVCIALPFFVFSCFFPSFVLSVFTDKKMIVKSGAPFLRALGISFLFFAPSQAIAAALRSVKKPKIPFFSALCALAVNVSLNIVLIFGKFGFRPLGILGAGIATAVARGVEFLILFIYAIFIDEKLDLKIPSFLKIDKISVKRFFKTGAPIIATQLVWSVNNFFSSALMGREDAAVIAGLSVAISLYNLSYVVTNGMSGAVGIITGRLVGKGDEKSFEKLFEYSRTVELLFILLGSITAIFMQLTKTSFISIWGIESAAAEWAIGFIGVLSLFVIGTAYQSASLNGLIKSAGKVRFVLKTESFFVFCVIIPLSLLASNLGASPILIFAVLKCDQILKCPVAFFKLKGLWKIKNRS